MGEQRIKTFDELVNAIKKIDKNLEVYVNEETDVFTKEDKYIEFYIEEEMYVEYYNKDNKYSASKNKELFCLRIRHCNSRITTICESHNPQKIFNVINAIKEVYDE